MRACVYIYICMREISSSRSFFCQSALILLPAGQCAIEILHYYYYRTIKIKDEYLRGVYLTPPSVLETLKARDFSSRHLLCF